MVFGRHDIMAVSAGLEEIPPLIVVVIIGHFSLVLHRRLFTHFVKPYSGINPHKFLFHIL
jgi:hypothetical protein